MFVDEAAEQLDSVVERLTAVLAASRHPKSAQAVRSLVLVQNRLTEISGLLGLVASELPVFLNRLGQSSEIKAADRPAVAASHGKDGKRLTSVSRPEHFEAPAEEPKTFRAWWGTTSREIDDAGTAESVIREAADRLFSGGPRGVAIRFGDHEQEQAPLRIYLDTSAGCAAVSWQGRPGIESGVEPGQPLIVGGEDPRLPQVTIPPERARVRPATAIRAAREYVETGRRPTCLDWNIDHAAPRPEREDEPRTGPAPGQN